MKIKSEILNYLHLDKNYSLLSAKVVRLLFEYFNWLDIHERQGMNDVQFYHFMKHATDLTRDQIYKVFDTLDVDGSGEIDFDEFYLLICILIAIKDNEEKQFIYRHSRTVFDLLDEDGSNSISAEEFEGVGFMFNFQGDAVRGIFHEFDVSGDQELDYKEFRMFAMACIDKQNELADSKKRELEHKRRQCQLREKTKQLKVLSKQGIKPEVTEEMKVKAEKDIMLDHSQFSYAYASLMCTII